MLKGGGCRKPWHNSLPLQKNLTNIHLYIRVYVKKHFFQVPMHGKKYFAGSASDEWYFNKLGLLSLRHPRGENQLLHKKKQREFFLGGAEAGGCKIS